MITVNKTECASIREKFPSVHIVRTKHHYYCEENRAVMRMLGRDTGDNRNGKNHNRRNNKRWRNNDR